MSRGSHRAEPVRRYLPRQIPRVAVAVAVGLGVALLGVSLVVALRPDTSSGPPTRAVDAADALRAAAALQADQRASRDGTGSPVPATPSSRPSPPCGPNPFPPSWGGGG